MADACRPEARSKSQVAWLCGHSKTPEFFPELRGSSNWRKGRCPDTIDFPQINLDGIKLDEKLWEYLRSQSEDNARHTGGKIANDLQLLQAYIKFAVSGQHVYTPKEAPAPLTRAGRILSSAADEAEREAEYEESLW